MRTGVNEKCDQIKHVKEAILQGALGYLTGVLYASMCLFIYCNRNFFQNPKINNPYLILGLFK